MKGMVALTHTHMHTHHSLTALPWQACGGGRATRKDQALPDLAPGRLSWCDALRLSRYDFLAHAYLAVRELN